MKVKIFPLEEILESIVLHNLVMLGPQACGKMTQAQLIGKALGHTHVEASGALTQMCAIDPEFEAVVAPMMLCGTHVPKEYLRKALNHKLTMVSRSGRFVFDGFPRNPDQFDIFDEVVVACEVQNLQVIFFNGDRQIFHDRAVKRKRPDDTLEALEKRFALYYEYEEALMEGFRERGYNVHSVLASGNDRTPEVIHEEVLGIARCDNQTVTI
jgi:adenylate kinase